MFPSKAEKVCFSIFGLLLCSGLSWLATDQFLCIRCVF